MLTLGWALAALTDCLNFTAVKGGTIRIGVSGGALFEVIDRHLGDPFFGIFLNPGHQIHLDEWVASPIFAGSTIELRSGMALQVDVTATPRHDNGAIFVQTVSDYPLVEAIYQNVVKHPTLPDEASIARLAGSFEFISGQLRDVQSYMHARFAEVDERFDRVLSHDDILALPAPDTQFAGFGPHALEFKLGIKRESAVKHYPAGSEGHRMLSQRYSEPSLWDSFLHYLARHGYAVPQELLDRDVTQPVEPSEPLQKILIDAYRNDLVARDLSERLVDLDEGVQEWRYRHVRMVERTIGFKRGTGGSAGAAYLRETLFKHAFPDLWTIRTEL